MTDRRPVPPPRLDPGADTVAVADTPLWLSHHWPSGYDRCVALGRRHLCRRCLVLYPLAAVVAGLGAAGLTWPRRHDAWAIWLLALPATLEFGAEHLGLVRHAPARLVAVTVPLAVACGVLYLRYLDRPSDPLVWAVVGVCGGSGLAVAVLRAVRPSGPGRR